MLWNFTGQCCDQMMFKPFTNPNPRHWKFRKSKNKEQRDGKNCQQSGGNSPEHMLWNFMGQCYDQMMFWPHWNFLEKKGTKRWEKTSPPQRWLTQGGLDCPINQEQILVKPKNGWPNTPNMGKAVMVHSGRQRIGYYPTTRHPIKLFIQASLAPPPPQKSHHSSSVLSPLAASECPTSLVNRSLFPRVWERERDRCLLRRTTLLFVLKRWRCLLPFLACANRRAL